MVTEISANPFLRGKDLISTGRKGIFCLVKIVFFRSVLLSCKSKLLLKLAKTSSLNFLQNGRS